MSRPQQWIHSSNDTFYGAGSSDFNNPTTTCMHSKLSTSTPPSGPLTTPFCYERKLKNQKCETEHCFQKQTEEKKKKNHFFSWNQTFQGIPLNSLRKWCLSYPVRVSINNPCLLQSSVLLPIRSEASPLWGASTPHDPLTSDRSPAGHTTDKKPWYFQRQSFIYLRHHRGSPQL